MDALGISNAFNRTNADANVLNSPARIIIKKENIGLHEYQHQRYQYSLFNNNEKRDKFYEDLTKVKDRLEKSAPNMQQVVHMDMKRAEVNKVYERKLRRELSGSRGLHWQYKQEIQRLENDEREAERDLKRLHHDLARASISSLSRQSTSIRQNPTHSRSQTPCFSVVLDTGSIIEATPITSALKVLPIRPMSIHINRTNTDQLPLLNPRRRYSSLSIKKSSLGSRDVHTKSKDLPPHLRKHASSINQQKREIEQKLKEFLQ